MPTKDELIARRYDFGAQLSIRSFEVDDLIAVLAEKGYAVEKLDHEEGPLPSRRVHVENVVTIGEPELRAAAKVALNYLAAVVGSDAALRSDFDKARNFARYGRARARVNVRPFHNRRFLGRTGHFISLRRSAEMVVVELSILMRTQYFVVLAIDPDHAIPIKATPHLFDLTDRRMHEIDPLPVEPGGALRAVKPAR